MDDFDNLVLDNADELKPFAITLTKDNEAAKDLYQETLYKALAYRTQYKTGTNIKAWLATIMRNIFINDYNRAERKKSVMEVVKASQPQYALSSEINLRIKEINHAIFHLPLLLKNAFLLHFEGYN
jgi:RNA polymerase sigma factor (sigma-70 family)